MKHVCPNNTYPLKFNLKYMGDISIHVTFHETSGLTLLIELSTKCEAWYNDSPSEFLISIVTLLI